MIPKTIAPYAVLILGLLAAALGDAATQPGKVPRVGYLSGGTAADPAFHDLQEALRQGLREAGYIPGQNISMDYRWAAGRQDRLPDLAAELVRLNVDVIVAVATPAAQAAQRATKTIPIVMLAVGDPVGSGLVASLARPGGNITGLSLLASELGGKRLQLLKETVPGVTRVAVFWNPANPYAALVLRETEAAGRILGMQLQSLEVRAPDDFEGAFRAATRGRAGAVIAAEDPFTFLHRKRLVDFAAQNRLPAVYGYREFAEAGGLMAHGTHLPDLWRRAATYVDKILKGAKPADLPVEQPTKFDLVINLKTARALGVTIPPSVLIRADEVIQ